MAGIMQRSATMWRSFRTNPVVLSLESAVLGPSAMVYEKGESRKIVVNNPKANNEFRNNAVTTSKYTFYNFFFKNLFEQFRRIANFYFLIISILQLSTDLSPTSQYNTILPLCAVLAVTMVKEAIEDVRRHQADNQINRAVAHALRGNKVVDVRWHELRVGDIILIFNKEGVPADFVILAASGENGLCHIETSNLDGETNLKLRHALHETNHFNTAEKLAGLMGELKCEAPNPHLYAFEGVLDTGGQQSPVGYENVVWRGCRIMNTKWVYGLVVYTGQESKLILNSRPASGKRSQVERQLNTAIVLLFVTLVVLCSISTALYAYALTGRESKNAWYLVYLLDQTDWDTALTWVTFLILYNNLVPISLYVTLELVKTVQARFINTDMEMYHADTDSPAEAHTSNLNEDLGQIEYIFSDKTGTLTCNDMEFRKCSIGGIIYGDIADYTPPGAPKPSSSIHHNKGPGISVATILHSAEGNGPSTNSLTPLVEDEKNTTFAPTIASLQPTPSQMDLLSKEKEKEKKPSLMVSPRSGKTSPRLRPSLRRPLTPNSRRESVRLKRTESLWDREQTGYSFDDRLFKAHLHNASHQNHELLHEFLASLALCHTVIPEKDELTGNVVFQASSPDEAALVTAAKHLGYDFRFRGNKMVVIDQLGESARYEILAVNEFHSDRKRMSVLIRNPAGQLKLHCKGADEVMIPLLRNFDDEVVMLAQSHLVQFSSEGLRTLIVAKRELDEAFCNEWLDRYTAAQNSLDNREQRLRALAAEIERSFDLVGATAIEDKLQDGVPEAIEKLTRAGIKVWMLTGDKLETAENIGFSCKLLDESLDLVKVDDNTKIKVHVAMARIIKRYKSSIGGPVDNLGLLITGQSLTFVFDDAEMRAMFLELCRLAKVVIACRVIPSQKADIVRTVRYGFESEPLTLAIGDGANDVAMIQEAHVGVGISGNEGMQAVRASDYSFAQFRFLERLLLVHGRWNYRRVSVTILYSFYKNIAVVLTLFYYGWVNGFSGTTLYESWLGAGWNIGWTVFPILFFGIFEQDLMPETILHNPHVYKHGQRRSEFNVRVFVRWILNAVVHSVIVFVLAYGTMSWNDISNAGHPTGLYLMGTIVNACMVITVQYRLMIETRHWVGWTFFGYFISLFIWSAFVGVYSSLIKYAWDFYGTAAHLFNRVYFYFLILIVPLTAVFYDLIFYHVKKLFNPTPVDIVQELEVLELNKAGVKNNPAATNWDFEERHLEGTSLLKSQTRLDVLLRRAPKLTRGPSGQEAVNITIQDHLEHLHQVIQGDHGHLSSAKEMIIRNSIRFTNEVDMHWLTLSFNDRQLEDEYEQQYIAKSVNFVRYAISICFAMVVIYTIITAVQQDGNTLLRIILTAVAFVGVIFMFTRYFQLFLYSLMVLILIGAGIARTLLVTSSGAIGMSVFAIVALLVLRNRFIVAIPVVIIDCIFYNIWTIWSGILTGSELIQVDYLQILIIFFGGYVCRAQEVAFRMDFLLQKDYQQEKERNQTILDNMMPAYVIKLLQKEAQMSLVPQGSVAVRRDSQEYKRAPVELARVAESRPLVANNEGQVSILFCDVVGFSELLTHGKPAAVVAILDAIYSTFDELCVKNGVQKMETVGKTYMACAGLQGTRKDHAHACVELGFDMLEIMKDIIDTNGEPMKIRIGINTGDVISGVVGIKRPQFSLFGDTVNTASRMQSTGEEGRIHVTQSTRDMLYRDYRMTVFVVPVKGKDVMTTYYVGDRFTKAPQNRRLDLVEKETDAEDILEEAGMILSAKRSVTMTDSYRSSAGQVPINRFSLLFENEADERAFNNKHRPLSGVNSRRPLLVAILFFMGEALFEYFKSPGDHSTAYIVTIFAVRYGLMVCWMLLFAFSYTDHFMKHGVFYITAAFVGGMIASIAVPLSHYKSLTDTRAALTYIFNMTLLCNSAMLRVVPNAAINVVSVVVWAIAAFAIADFNTASDTEISIQQLFFVFGGAVINLVASYARELYLRREFVLLTQVEIEKRKAEEALYLMIPPSVADRIKAGESFIAQEYPNVTILYSDIKGFTDYSAHHRAAEVVQLLSELFTHFDQFTDNNQVYKIQTIGDAYVLVGGLPFLNPRNGPAPSAETHANNVVRMGMDMLEVINNLKVASIKMRIGIHTGTIIGGIIGTKQLRYDIWGTDCLVANSMESNGKPGCICISETTKQLLEGRYVMRKHEMVPRKGQDAIQSYLVVHSFEDPTRKIIADDLPELPPSHSHTQSVGSMPTPTPAPRPSALSLGAPIQPTLRSGSNSEMTDAAQSLEAKNDGPKDIRRRK